MKFDVINQVIGVMVLVLIALVSACSGDKETVDTEYPVIDMDYMEAYPVQCAVIPRGEVLVFRARFSDNVALGAFNVNIHHNFDQHSHSTEVDECDMEPVKSPVNPFRFDKQVDAIPAGQKNYEAHIEIPIPENVDPGDYHFMIHITDHAGWTTRKGLSVKIK